MASYFKLTNPKTQKTINFYDNGNINDNYVALLNFILKPIGRDKFFRFLGDIFKQNSILKVPLIDFDELIFKLSFGHLVSKYYNQNYHFVVDFAYHYFPNINLFLTEDDFENILQIEFRTIKDDLLHLKKTKGGVK